MFPVMLQIPLILAVAAYILLTLLFLYGLREKEKRHPQNTPTVAIIIAARNEADNIRRCLQSIAQIDYPKDRLQVVIVDDHSSDRTSEIIQEIIRGRKNYRLVSLTDPGTIGRGKMAAVACGIEASTAEFICLTDADCMVPPGWVSGLLSLFDDRTGLAGSITLMDQPGVTGPLSGKIQSLDWLYLLSIARSAATLGWPQSWVGNNLAFRRAAYEQVGGFRRLDFSLTEDFALLRAIARETRWHIRFALLADAMVVSQPVQPLTELYRQRRRWAAGIRHTPLLGLLSMITSFSSHIFIIACCLFSRTIVTGLIGLGVLFLCDASILIHSVRKLGRRDLLRFFPLFELYYFVYTTVLALALIFDRNITWKGITYPKGHSE